MIHPLRLRRFCFVLAMFGGLGCRHTSPAEMYASRIGVAVKLADRICMAVRNSKLLPSATITLVAPGDPAKDILVHTARALISLRGVETCPGVGSDLSSYNLEITSGVTDEDVPLIALDARVPSVMAAHSFQSCRAGGGVHLTAWDGAKPLEGHRLWHQYYSLGHPVNSDCTAAETAIY